MTNHNKTLILRVLHLQKPRYTVRSLKLTHTSKAIPFKHKIIMIGTSGREEHFLLLKSNLTRAISSTLLKTYCFKMFDLEPGKISRLSSDILFLLLIYQCLCFWLNLYHWNIYSEIVIMLASCIKTEMFYKGLILECIY